MLRLSKIINQPEDSNTQQENKSLPALLDGYLKREELALALGVSPRTIDRWESLRVGPPRVIVCGFVIYSIDSVKTWLKSREKVGARARQPRTKKWPLEKPTVNMGMDKAIK